MVRGESHKDIGRRVRGQGSAGAKLLRQKQACPVRGPKAGLGGWGSLWEGERGRRGDQRWLD